MGLRQANITSFKKGIIPWNKTAGIHINCDHCGIHINCDHCGIDMRIEPNQVGRKKFCSKSCFYKGRELKALFEKGHSDLVPASSRGHNDETKQKLKLTLRKNVKRGKGHPNWQGGLRTERKTAMASFEYRDWRKSVFERDNYTCQSCGIKGCYLEADHIKPWCAFPELRYELSNGRTLCRPCHVKQDTHGRNALKYKEMKNE